MIRSTELVAALGALLAAFPASAEEKVVNFSHEVHVVNSELACTKCHKAPKEGGLPKLSQKACGTCHEELPPYKLPGAKAARLSMPFPHEKHAKAEGMKCEDCHQAVLAPEGYAGKPMVTTAQCFECHNSKGLSGVSANCAGCHGKDARTIRPSDHRENWMVRHGAESEQRVFEEHGGDCWACHGNDACRTCHRQVRPSSHTGLWRVREHGVAASWDRDSCKTCHETGACVGCHRTARPMNHNAAWRSMHGLAAATADNQGCAACHAPSYCANCHGQGGR